MKTNSSLEEIVFDGNIFSTQKGIYVPMPQTELLVDYVDKLIQENSYSSVVEVGTGTGAVAISLALRNPNLAVGATDTDKAIRRVLLKNILGHEVNVRTTFTSYVDYYQGSQPDLIVANLPYGSMDFLLEGNTLEKFRDAPNAFFHPDGEMASYMGLVDSVRSRGWKTRAVLEVGPMPQEITTELEPHVDSFKHIPLQDGYSILDVEVR